MTKIFELVFFDGELLFHNDRNFSPIARFYGYECELEIFTDIVEKRESTYSDFHKKLFDEIDPPYEYETDDEYDKYSAFCEKPEIEQIMTFYDYSKISWKKSKISAFTLLDIREKLYGMLEHYGKMSCYWTSKGKIKEYRKVEE
jgi:hypothetical protein